MHIGSSSDEDANVLDVEASVKINQRSRGQANPSTPPIPSLPSPKNKKRRVEIQEEFPTASRQLGTLDLITTLRADTSFDENIWSQANSQF